ncbi:hypothetical protein QVH07_10325 [Algoriphagus sp. C2-7]|uniref:Uncharacterized protein n=2 Tax=Algoriphagus sediminis TaxID=3057113 RepID=A0ABT7YDE0_9BACT|nr:hypothetical protein [Algoriphagus sediminis]MDN3204547.1 hypothetical protein [Algoriphagus sediminis]
MFDSRDYPKPLDESIFESWLEQGRESKISYAFLLVIWDEGEQDYLPKFAETRDEIAEYERLGESYGRQALVAAYDLYSEGKIA